MTTTPLMGATQSSSILFPVGLRKIAWQTSGGDYVNAANHIGIVRGDTKQLLNVVGTGYQLVPMSELLNVVEQSLIAEIPSHLREGVRIKDAAAAYGHTCIRDYMFPNFTTDIGSKSSVGFRFVVSNGYGNSAMRLLAGAIEFYCSNGIVIGQYDTAYFRHTKGLTVKHVSENVSQAVNAYRQGVTRWRKWTHTPVANEQAMTMLRAIATSPQLFDKLSDRWLIEKEDRGPSLWALVSTLTYYSSHPEDQVLGITRVNDNTTPTTMLRRELQVSQLVMSKEFRELENV